MRKWIFIIGLIVLFIAFVYFTYWQNTHIQTTRYTIKKGNLTRPITIAHLSDLHNEDWGEQLYLRIKKFCPDYIVLTGDMVDYYHPNIKCTLEQIKPLVDIAPVYFVQGNHEHYSIWYKNLTKQLWSIGVTVLDDTYVETEDCFIIGLMDGSMNVPVLDSDKFKILLAHRPEKFDFYAAENMDLVLSGHTHGGQLRLPFIGGFFAPTQGFFPEYVSGKYEKNQVTMIISRGLGNSSFPFRLFNQPELVVVNLIPMQE